MTRTDWVAPGNTEFYSNRALLQKREELVNGYFHSHRKSVFGRRLRLE